MRIGRSARVSLVVTLLVTLSTGFARAQQQRDPSIRGLELEQAGKLREAAIAYREALGDGSAIPALLGLERVYSLLGRSDSLLPLIDTLMSRRPRDTMLRTIQLRTLTGLRRDAESKLAFERWVQIAPRDPVPFREFARLLLDDNRAGAADTVLQRAQQVFGSAKDFAFEMAQLRAALGMWEPSARSWRDAVITQPYLDQAAVFALYPAPVGLRDSVRRVLLAPPVETGARRILASLEIRWSSAREGWMALRDLPPNDSSVAAWLSFAEQAQDNSAWVSARDALAAALRVQPSDSIAAKAVNAALNAGDARSALDLLGRLTGSASEARRRVMLPLRVRALAALGRAEEAEQAVASAGGALDSATRATVTRTIAWGWVRAGDLVRARAALAQVGGEEDDRTTGWIALYEGDLATARKALRRATETNGDLVSAMSLLARTRRDESKVVGAAFLALARGDTTMAITRFMQSADSVADAAPLLLGAAARLYAARGDDVHSVAIWRTLVDKYSAFPEAAEAELEWARQLRRTGDLPGAIQRLEHLILTHPQSALVPQARRELDLARNAVPPEEGK
jgi:tetratricopeptide (TPR) repeat protein